MAKRRAPKTHTAKDYAGIVRYNKEEGTYWLDSSTISITPEGAMQLAEEAETKLPRFYSKHPAAGLYQIDMVARLYYEAPFE